MPAFPHQPQEHLINLSSEVVQLLFGMHMITDSCTAP